MHPQLEHSAIPKTAPPCRLVPFFLLNWAGLNTLRWLTTQPHGGWNQVIYLQANDAGDQYRNLGGPFTGAVTKHRVLYPKGLLTSRYYKQHFLSVCYDFKSHCISTTTAKNLFRLSRYNWYISSQAEMSTRETTTRELNLRYRQLQSPHPPQIQTTLNRRKLKHRQPDAWQSPAGKCTGVSTWLYTFLLYTKSSPTYLRQCTEN